ncbi:MAG: LacI family DNA-binding transcriptional regulator [Kiloniellales bacterium]|nr:LacI family DNA-binding transcriptional regulator [Kiloniellales bacterium]
MTLQEVADRAGVSPMTVSNFINDKFQYMSQATRKRVAAAVADLNYRPDTAGRSLRSARHKSIGMIVVDESPLYLSDGSTTQVVSGLGNALNAEGYTLQLEGLRGRDLANSSLLRLVRTDGVCLMLSGKPAQRRAMLASVQKLNQPLIVFYERSADGSDDLCLVRQNDRQGGILLAEHLFERGVRRIMIAKIMLNQWSSVDERVKGVRSVAAKRGGEVEIVGCGSGAFDEVQAAVNDAIAESGLPDAIMALTDQMGIAVLKLLKAKGVKVPKQVRVTGFNAFEYWRLSDPVLTTVRSPGYELGQVAGREMIRRLETGAFSQRVIKLPVELVIGETT